MNIILFDREELSGNLLELRDRRAHHIRKILQARPGDKLQVGQINGPTGTGLVTEISPNLVTLNINLANQPPDKAMVDLILALPRPIMLKRILSQSATLGVDNIFLINSRRVEKSFFNASLLDKENIRQYLCAGLEQSTTTRLPQISIHPRFRPFIEDIVPQVSKSCPVRLVAHPGITNLLPQVAPRPLTKKVLLAIGPEGGWLDYEIGKFREQGFKPFSMGRRILKVETAVVALLAQLELLRNLVK
jgi:RsmE family RNA methyltransferase